MAAIFFRDFETKIVSDEKKGGTCYLHINYDIILKKSSLSNTLKEATIAFDLLASGINWR